KLIKEAVDGVTTVEREVKDRQGNTLSLRIRPYKNLENRIDGAVVALFDQEGGKSQEIWEVFNDIIEVLEQPVAVVDEDFRILQFNSVFKKEFGDHGRGELIYQALERHVDATRLRELLEEKVPRDGRVDRFELG